MEISSERVSSDHPSSKRLSSKSISIEGSDKGSTKGYKDTLQHWRWELLGCFLTSVCLVTIVAVVGSFDHHDQPDWPMGMTLNSLVAFLDTVCRWTSSCLISQATAQMKWNQFATGKPKPLSHLIALDDASRGLWGSTRLLFTRSGRSTLGVLIFVVTASNLLTSAMTQAAVTTTWCPVNSTNDERPWVAKSPNPIFIKNEIMSSMAMHAIQRGFLTPAEEHILPLDAVGCETGHCDFPLFSTLGICAETSNVTTELSFADSTITSYEELQSSVKMNPDVFESMGLGVLRQPIRNASLPTGQYLVGAKHLFSLNMSGTHHSPSPRWNPTWMPQSSTISFGKDPDILGSAISNYYLIWLNQGYFYPNGTEKPEDPLIAPSRKNVDQAFRATEVLLRYCVQTYNVSVRYGHTNTSRIDTKTYVESIDTTIDSDNKVDGSVTLGASANNETVLFTALADTFSQFDELFQPLFTGTFAFNRYYGSGHPVRGLTPGSEAVGHAFWTRTLTPTISDLDKVAQSAIDNISRNVADSLTNRLRGGLDSTGSPKSDGSVPGTAFNNKCIVIRWPFLSFLVVQVLVSIMFLISIIIHTATLDVDVVKGMLLPALFAIDGEERSRLLQGGETVDDEVFQTARAMAPRIIGGLRGDGAGGWKLD